MSDAKEKLVELCNSAITACRTINCEECNLANIPFPECEAIFVAGRLNANGVTVQKWVPASEPPEEYRDECRELIPFLVCERETEYPFRAFYDGKTWGDGLSPIYPTHWMKLPKPLKGE